MHKEPQHCHTITAYLGLLSCVRKVFQQFNINFSSFFLGCVSDTHSLTVTFLYLAQLRLLNLISLIIVIFGASLRIFCLSVALLVCLSRTEETLLKRFYFSLLPPSSRWLA